MSTRGVKKRGRPPKVQVSERGKKFQYHLLKKPKYLQNFNKGSDSQSSTPNTSRPCSPHENVTDRRGSRTRGKNGHKSTRKGGMAGSAYPRRGYNPHADYHDSEYHYGSDFGDDSSEKSDPEDEMGFSDSESNPSVDDGDRSSDSDFSLSSFSTLSGTPRKTILRPASPEPLWLQNRELPPLNLPRSSDDLLVPREFVMPVIGIYEVLRHFRNLVRISPFRIEDFCAALVCEDQSSLLTEIHIMLLKALLREEDSQQTHFGPLDQKDSVNISIYLIDNMTYPEVLRAYVESDKNFDADVLDVFNTTDYPFTSLGGRIKVLKFLTDQFLITNPVREDLLSEVPMHYDDHCRVCHKLGDLLCCETCPAVYHLECVDPPLTKIPDDDWQCGICRSHRVSGVVDCILDIEKQGQLCRQECLGYDRLGRKYYFLCRRIFIENDKGEIYYYTTSIQFEELLKVLDSNEMEASLCRELFDCKKEIVRQMNLTEKLTCQFKGNKKSYLEIENAAIIQANKELAEMQEECLEVEKQSTESMRQENSVSLSNIELANEVEVVYNADVECKDTTSDSKSANSITEKLIPTTSITNNNKSILSTQTDSKIEELLAIDSDLLDAEKKKDKDSRLKIDSFTGRTSGLLNKADSFDSARMTRLKSSQLANGTLLYKLGLENQFKTYVNQYTTNPIALNKPQRNEERDKKRHLSHKFSLTAASEFKWIGGVNGSRNLLLNTLKQTLLQLEQSLQAPFMHPNWPLLRKHWLAAVGSCQQPKDYSRTVIVLQACIKAVAFANVWHEHLGHIKLHRMTANEREERKKYEKREKKEREEEEERNRTIITGYIKYTMGFKHQLWKQKGEEYRIHGRWGWMWLSSCRSVKNDSCAHLSLSAGPQRYMVQVRDEFGLKTLGVNSSIYSYLCKNFELDNGTAIVVKTEEKNEKEQNDGNTNLAGNSLKHLKVIPSLNGFEEIDVSRALANSGRLLYPKVARKSQLDDFLARRLHLKLLEEKKILHKMTTEESHNDDDIDVVNDDLDVTDGESGIEKQLNSMITGKVPMLGSQQHTHANRELLNTITKKIQILRLHYTSISKLAKDYQCYSKGCNTNTSTLLSNCYSPFCLQRNKVRRELLALLRKANLHTNAQNTLKLPNILGITLKKLPVPTIKPAKEKVNLDEATIRRELLNALKSAPIWKEESDLAYVLSKQITSPVPKIKEEIKCEAEEGESTKMDIQEEILHKCNDVTDYEDVDMERMSPDAIKEMIVGNTKSLKDNKNCNRYNVPESITAADGIMKDVLVGTNTATASSVHSNNALNGKFPIYSAQQNRRFCAYKSTLKRDDNVTKTERAEDGTERVYSAVSSMGKVYLKRSSYSVLEKRKKKPSIKYPISATFQNKRGIKSILMLQPQELHKLSRSGGRIYINGFHHLAKPNNVAWPYPCSRPLFKSCWLYRTVNVRSLSGIASQLRIMWSCLRWDDMQAKIPNSDGKHQITTETEILSLELLKHRYIGPFLERAQYLRRKVVIPLELPKTIREVTSIRSGLRKRKRPESPQCTDPQVTEEWVDEEKLELWEIKQYGERLEKANVQVITRSRTGNLPPTRSTTDVSPSDSPNKTPAANKSTPEEIKEKMEQQLRLQRAAHQQKRALELKSPQGQLIKMVGSTTQVATSDGHMKLLKNVGPSAASGKSTLTSLLTSNTPGGANKFAGRRIYMTKAADGTARLITTPANILPKGSVGLGQQSLIKGPQNVQVQVSQSVTTATPTPSTKSSEIPQRVQIVRSPDGRVTVKGLMPGQQLIQMPDGTLQVLSNSQIQSAATSVTTTPKPTLNTPLKAIIKTPPSITTLTGKLILQNNQVKAVTQTPGQATTKNHIIVKQGTTPLLQKIGTPTTTVVTSVPQVSQQDSNTVQQISSTPVQQIVANQIIVNNSTLAQQIATGKLQVASVNGQQVLIRPTGNGQAQVVAQITPGNVAHAQLPNQNINQTVTTRQITPPQVAPEQTIQQKTNQENANQIDSATMEHLLAGQPAGTVIKCVTAQVIQTQQGPRIVLQGLQGAEFSSQQLAAVQHQVKQQLLKAQASTGKQGVLGPTKIYLAVQPSGAETVPVPNSQPPPLTPVQQVITPTSLPTSVQDTKIQQSSNPTQASFVNVAQPIAPSPRPTPNSQQVCSMPTAKPKPKVVVQPANQMNENNSGIASRQVLVNGQQSAEAPKPTMEGNHLAVAARSADPKDANKEFVVTPDYIQQTIKTALKQENLNPDIEEKLLQLQRYQENKMKQEPEPPPIAPRSISNVNQPSVGNIRVLPRKRPPSCREDDTEWIMETPKRSRIIKPIEIIKKEEPIPMPKDKIVVPPRARVKLKDSPEDEKRVAMKTKIMVAVFRQKEALKKEILRKRALLERDLQCEIQKEVAEELAARTRLERTRQDEVRSSANRRKSTSGSQPSPQTNVSPPAASTTTSITSTTTTPSSCSSRSTVRGKKHLKHPSTPSTPSKNKKEKVYCICRTPYDETKFYVGCDLCNNWFHGECVSITEESSKTMTEFICTGCKHARDTQEIFCLCKQPYDESQFYICCDSCQDWFHGRCVGILQSEAENIDEYVCPNCQKNSSVNYANMKNLSDRDFDGLRKLMKQIQAHKSAWPFMEPVDPAEAPDYYKVIKEPMDLQKIDNKIAEKRYNKLSEFIGDMTKIFDNCRYYNPKESPFFKCAESLEAYFVNKIQFLREKLSENNK